MNASFYISDQSKDRHYKITFHHDKLNDYISLTNDEGEGMSLNEESFFNLLDKYFKDKF